MARAFSGAQWYPNHLRRTGRHDVVPAGILYSAGEAAEEDSLWAIWWLWVFMARHLNHFLGFWGQCLLQVQRCPRWLYLNVALSSLPQPSLGTSVPHCVLQGKTVTVGRIRVQIHNFPREEYFSSDLWNLSENLSTKDYIFLCVDKAPQRFSVLY